MCGTVWQQMVLFFCIRNLECSFSADTDWKLGLLGRSGKGKTTFLGLLQGKFPYQGTISAQAVFDYFPYAVSERQMRHPAADFMEELKAGCEQSRVICEMEQSVNLYVWDEPLNYVDVFSRMQIEKLILDYEPTMLFVEHDARFREKIATGTVLL